MAIQTYRPTLNAGQVYMRVAGSAAPLIAVGNVSALALEITEDEKTLQDFTRPGGGQWAAVSRVTGVNATMTLHDLDPVNLSRAVYGDAAAEAADTVIDEAHTAYEAGLIRLEHIDPSAVTITCGAPAWVASTVRALGDFLYEGTHAYKCTTPGTSHASVEPTWPTDGSAVTDGTAVWTDMGAFAAVADTDYELRPEGIMILEDGGIPDGCPVLIDYTYGAYDVVQALTSGSPTMELSFGGINEANSNSPVVLDIFRLKVSAASNLSMIGDDFAALELSGKVLLDATKTGTGISRYFKVSMAA